MRLQFVIAVCLLMILTPVAPGAESANTSCHDEGQTNGVGGQQVSCTFECEGRGQISVSVQADDPGATVSGTAECGGGRAHCTGTQSCVDEDSFSGNGTGGCSADSDELIDSGLYVECTSFGTGDNVPEPDPIFVPRIDVCIGGECPDRVASCIDQLLEGVNLLQSTSFACSGNGVAFIMGPSPTGVACVDGLRPMAVVPHCYELTDGRWRCVV